MAVLPMMAQLTLSGLDSTKFREVIDGKETHLYVLTNSKGCEAAVTNYGGRLVSLMVPNKKGRMVDVVLGYDNVSDYHTKGQNFGATVGRYIGRIIAPKDGSGNRQSQPSIDIDGINYPLQGSGKNYISHGGKPGFANRVWSVARVTDNSVMLKYLSPDGENGFPGNLEVVLTYRLNDDNSLEIIFRAETDKPTVHNLSNHSFFNISGDLNNTILDEELQVFSDSIATFDLQKNVDGKFMRVKGTPFDFTRMTYIGDSIDAANPQLGVTRGYDHSFMLRKNGSMTSKVIRYAKAARLYDNRSGITMKVYTTEPVVHIYTGNGLKGNQIGKGGIAYQRRSAICLETMKLADSPHHANFHNTVLRPGEVYMSATKFKFSAR